MNNIILKNMCTNKEYVRVVLPYLKVSYFDETCDKHVFKLIRDHIVKYRVMPSFNELKVEMKNIKANEHVFTEVSEKIDELYSASKMMETQEWLINSTEKWIQSQAFTAEVLKAAEAITENDQGKMNEMPSRIQDALAIQFDNEIGIEFLDDDDIESRWKKYHTNVKKYSTLIEQLDRVFHGGIEPKSLTCLLAGTNVGKTMAMISLACNFVRQGYDVLYVTLEMSEEKIAMRADANFLGIPINDIVNTDEEKYIKSLKNLKKKTPGRLVIKEFAPTTINCNHLRSLLDELEIKKDFKPQIVIVDYLNLMLSSRYSGDSMYSTVKSITEELRGLMVERELAGLSATQGNRETNSSTNSDMDLTNTSESIGLPQTLDAMIAMIFPEELREQNLQIWKILKNRFGDIINYKFYVGVDFNTARFFDAKDGPEISGNNGSVCAPKEKNTSINLDTDSTTSDMLDY